MYRIFDAFWFYLSAISTKSSCPKLLGQLLSSCQTWFPHESKNIKHSYVPSSNDIKGFAILICLSIPRAFGISENFAPMDTLSNPKYWTIFLSCTSSFDISFSQRNCFWHHHWKPQTLPHVAIDFLSRILDSDNPYPILIWFLFCSLFHASDIAPYPEPSIHSLSNAFSQKHSAVVSLVCFG